MIAKSQATGPDSGEKTIIIETCQNFIDQVLKPRFLPVIRPTEFNYPIDIIGKWHGGKYRFVQRYRSGFSDNRGKEFDAPFARLDWKSHNCFDIQWHRHTGTWFRLHPSLTLKQAIKTLETDGILHPL